MSDSDKKKPNRRDFILTATTAAGAVGVGNDRDINVEWPIDNEDIVLSSKDKSGNSLKYILDN